MPTGALNVGTAFSSRTARRSPIPTAVILALDIGLLPGAAVAQAWLPPAGERTLTMTFQTTTARGELDRDGRPYWEDGQARTHGFVPELEWGLTERVAVNLSLPLLAARYRGNHAHTFDHHGESSSLDDGTLHGGTQDFRLVFRYGLKQGIFAIAPFAEGVVPSRDYEFIGHSAIGDGLWLLRAGVNVGGFLEDVAPGLYFHTQLSYTVAEKLVDIRTNRSRLDSEVGYFVTPRLVLRLLETLVITHDGLDFPEARFDIPVFLFNHDPLKRRDSLNLGGGVGFSLTDSLGAFAAVVATVWGKNVHPIRGVSTGITWQLGARRGALAPSRTSPQNAIF